MQIQNLPAALKQCLFFLFYILGVPIFINAQPIVGGSQIPITDAPYQVSIEFYDTQTQQWAYGCGGTILSDTWILTAGHCVKSWWGDLTFTPITINVAIYQTGQYAVILFCNGSVADYKNIIIN